MSERAPVFTPSRVPITASQKKGALARINRRHSPLGVLWEWSKSFVIAITLFLFVRAFFVEAFKIPSGSMERTLLVGDFLLVNKLVYGPALPFTSHQLPPLRAPRRGDIIVFQYPKDESKTYVKRLVGLSGDTVAMLGGVLVLNGIAQREGYVSRTQPDDDSAGQDFGWQRHYLVRTAEASGVNPSRNNWGPLVVPEKSYFVLGDNRDNSSDSRYWGFVPDSLVRGQPLFVYYSFTPDTARPLAWLTSIRWQRLGERIH